MQERETGIDLTRGIAIALMLLSHTVMALMYKSRVPDWGWIPVHLITKFASTTFFLSFGISLHMYVERFGESDQWWKRKLLLLYRGVFILVMYEILSVLQLLSNYPTERIIDVLRFEAFPDFVAVLSFYGFFLLWFPFFLRPWTFVPLPLKFVFVVGFFLGGNYLFENWPPALEGYDSLKTILVEYENRFSFGQLQRGAIVLLGLIFGDFLVRLRQKTDSDLSFSVLTFSLSAIAIGVFLSVSYPDLQNALHGISRNVGKHPPNASFTSFSFAGALLILSFCTLVGDAEGFSHPFLQRLRSLFLILLTPLRIIGQNALFVFNLHIVFIFLFMRAMFSLKGEFKYPEVLLIYLGILSLGCIASLFKNNLRIKE